MYRQEVLENSNPSARRFHSCNAKRHCVIEHQAIFFFTNKMQDTSAVQFKSDAQNFTLVRKIVTSRRRGRRHFAHCQRCANECLACLSVKKTNTKNTSIYIIPELCSVQYVHCTESSLPFHATQCHESFIIFRSNHIKCDLFFCIKNYTHRFMSPRSSGIGNKVYCNELIS